jgi:hypothetical protein
MTAKTTIAVRRNTAMQTQSLVEAPCLSLLRQEVPDGSMIWSFDPSDPQNEALVYAVDGQGTREWTQHTSDPFCLTNWACKRVLMESEQTGDLQPALRITLIDDDDETLSFVSVGIAASLDLIRTLRGDGPYSPPIPLVVTQIKTRKGFSTLKLRPVMGQKNKDAKPKS